MWTRNAVGDIPSRAMIRRFVGFPCGTAIEDAFATTTTPLVCTVTTPCFTTPTAQNNGGQYGYGAPFTTLEVDKLFGYTFSYIHPVGANIFSATFDHYLDDASDFINDTSPLAPGCTFVKTCSSRS